MDSRDWVMESSPWYIAGRPIILLCVVARYGDAQHPAHFSAYMGKILQYSLGILDKHLSWLHCKCSWETTAS